MVANLRGENNVEYQSLWIGEYSVTQKCTHMMPIINGFHSGNLADILDFHSGCGVDGGGLPDYFLIAVGSHDNVSKMLDTFIARLRSLGVDVSF
jgi:hypothetical protein